MLRNIFFLLLIIFILNTNNIHAQPNINKRFSNIIIHKIPKDLPVIELKNKDNNKIVLNNFSSNITLINFWATWCAPCKKELPQLQQLSSNTAEGILKVALVNIENKDFSQIQKFLNNLQVYDLEVYFDHQLKLVRELSLRGIPITLLINTKGKEVARIIGDINFTDPELIKWIKSL